jgi:two-component system nitrate/nitrite response regulator NarL
MAFLGQWGAQDLRRTWHRRRNCAPYADPPFGPYGPEDCTPEKTERDSTVREPNIAVVSDQNAFREGIVQLLLSQGGQRVTEYRSGADFLSAAEGAAPRMVLIDLEHSTDDPVALLRDLRSRVPGTTVVIIGTAQQSSVAYGSPEAPMETSAADAQVLCAVASLEQSPTGSPDALQDQAEAQHQRKLWSMLTPRQREVLGFLATGSDNLKIAANLGISERAVKAHVSALLSLFTAENRTELAVLACRAGLRPPLRALPRSPVLARARAS